MSTLVWIISLGLMVACLYEAHQLRRGTVCRQKAWLKATEARTRALIVGARTTENLSLSGCGGTVFRRQHELKLILNGRLSLFEIKAMGYL